MKVSQAQWTLAEGWIPSLAEIPAVEPQLTLLFASAEILRDSRLIAEIKARFPQTIIFGCSTAGEIRQSRVFDDTLVLTAVEFEHTTLNTAKVDTRMVADSRDVGVQLARQFPPDGLRHIFVLSDGLKVNGSELVKGLAETLPACVGITGGLSGDGGRFVETLVISGDKAESGVVAALGLYGARLKIGCGSLGGWDPFGPERLITRSKGNMLYELDGKSALDLYKQYLGEHSQGLPATGLLFPLCLRNEGGGAGVVRTILAINEDEHSMTFAGDVPEGGYARLMKANFDRLIDGAVGAAKNSLGASPGSEAELAILISCVGRKMVLKQRVEEEVEGVREVLGERPTLTGFYSYGEISPFTPNAKCELHNQTMTVTTFRED